MEARFYIVMTMIGPRVFVAIVTVLWAVSLWLTSDSPWVLLASLWFLFNFYVWFVPSWRRNIVDRRGPLLGVGFAFAASLVSAVVDGLDAGWGSGVSLFFIRFIVLTVPIVLPFTVKLTPYPHRVDLVVLAYALVLPRLPGFSNVWFELPGGRTITIGILCMLGLLATHFFGARTWTAAPLDLKPRSRDIAHSMKTAVYAIVGVGVAGILLSFQNGFSLTRGLSDQLRHTANLVFGTGSLSEALPLIVLSLGLAVIAETLIFRGLLQAGVSHWIPEKFSKQFPKGVAIASALLAAAVHSLAGVYGLTGIASFGFALGLSWAFRQSKRFFPAVLGQSIALITLATVGLLLR